MSTEQMCVRCGVLSEEHERIRGRFFCSGESRCAEVVMRVCESFASRNNVPYVMAFRTLWGKREAWKPPVFVDSEEIEEDGTLYITCGECAHENAVSPKKSVTGDDETRHFYGPEADTCPECSRTYDLDTDDPT